MKFFPLLLLFICNSYLAQIGLKAVHIRPTGTAGMVLKPTFSGELIYKDFDEDSKVLFRGTIGFVKFKPRMDTFPTTGFIASNSTTVVPGYMVYRKYNLLYISGGFDFPIRLTEAFNLYPGFDLTVGGNSIDYDDHYPLISSGGFVGGDQMVGLGLRAGAEYLLLENLACFFECRRNFNLIVNQSFFTYNDYGIGVRYKF